MKRLVAIAAVCTVALTGWASADPAMMQPTPGSAELELLKSLVGTWKGMMPMGEGGEAQEITVEYRVTAGGSAIVERFNPNTPMEMVTVYHDSKDGKVMLTHYCMLGNQPQMDLVESAEDVLTFSLRDGSVTAESPHMHSVSMAIDGDTLTQSWVMWAGGEPKESGIWVLMTTMPTWEKVPTA